MDNSDQILDILTELRDFARKDDERNRNLVRFLYAFAAGGALIVALGVIAIGYSLAQLQAVLNSPPPM